MSFNGDYLKDKAVILVEGVAPAVDPCGMEEGVGERGIGEVSITWLDGRGQAEGRRVTSEEATLQEGSEGLN